MSEDEIKLEYYRRLKTLNYIDINEVLIQQLAKEMTDVYKQLNIPVVSNNEVALKAFVEEYVEAFEDGQGSDTALYRKAKSLL